MSTVKTPSGAGPFDDGDDRIDNRLAAGNWDREWEEWRAAKKQHDHQLAEFLRRFADRIERDGLPMIKNNIPGWGDVVLFTEGNHIEGSDAPGVVYDESVLDTVDEAIAKTEAVIAKLKQVRAGLLHDLLTRGLDEHGQLRDPIAHPDQFQDSPVGRIPRPWEARTLAGLCSYIGSGVTPRGGQDVYTREGVVFIRSQNVRYR